MGRQAGCAIAAAAALAATVLPWSSTAAAGRNGWETASLALALDEAMHQPLLAGLAHVWFAVPLAAALALCACFLLPRRPAVVALRALGALLVLDVLVVLVALQLIGPDVSLLGPLLVLAGGAALVALPARSSAHPRTRRDDAASTGAPS